MLDHAMTTCLGSADGKLRSGGARQAGALRPVALFPLRCVRRRCGRSQCAGAVRARARARVRAPRHLRRRHPRRRRHAARCRLCAMPPALPPSRSRRGIHRSRQLREAGAESCSRISATQRRFSSCWLSRIRLTEVNGARWPSRSSKSVAARVFARGLGSTPRRFRQPFALVAGEGCPQREAQKVGLSVFRTSYGWKAAAPKPRSGVGGRSAANELRLGKPCLGSAGQPSRIIHLFFRTCGAAGSEAEKNPASGMIGNGPFSLR